jgi:hypothetical protein
MVKMLMKKQENILIMLLLTANVDVSMKRLSLMTDGQSAKRLHKAGKEFSRKTKLLL